MSGDARIDEGELGRADGPLGLARGPGRDLLNEEDRCQQFEIPIQSSPGNAGFRCQRGRNQEAAGAASQ
jgi:hypothetical protein